MINGSMFVIAVKNLKQSISYYRQVLGFEIHDIGDPGWRIFQRGDCRIMAGECPDSPAAGELGDHSYFAYLYVDDVDGLYDEFRTAGARILKKPTSEPWGMREMAVKTIDGHRFMAGEELD